MLRLAPNSVLCFSNYRVFYGTQPPCICCALPHLIARQTAPFAKIRVLAPLCFAKVLRFAAGERRCCAFARLAPCVRFALPHIVTVATKKRLALFASRFLFAIRFPLFRRKFPFGSCLPLWEQVPYLCTVSIPYLRKSSFR